RERAHEVPALVGASPAAQGIAQTGERVQHRVEVRRDMKAEMLEIVSRIDRDRELAGPEHGTETKYQLDSADAATQCQDQFATGFGMSDPVRCCMVIAERLQPHRNMSNSLGLRRAAAFRGDASQSSPRMCTSGKRSLDWPISIDAAAAISSANAISVTRIALPNRSGAPIRLSSEGRPAAPSATPTTPLRHGRPKLSLITMPRSAEKAWSIRAFSIAHEASGSTGRSRTRSFPSRCSMLD